MKPSSLLSTLLGFFVTLTGAQFPLCFPCGCDDCSVGIPEGEVYIPAEYRPAVGNLEKMTCGEIETFGAIGAIPPSVCSLRTSSTVADTCGCNSPARTANDAGDKAKPSASAGDKASDSKPSGNTKITSPETAKDKRDDNDDSARSAKSDKGGSTKSSKPESNMGSAKGGSKPEKSAKGSASAKPPKGSAKGGKPAKSKSSDKKNKRNRHLRTVI